MAKVQRKGLDRIARAAVYSMKGFRAGLENEAAVRQEMCLATLMTVGAALMASSLVELLLLVAFPWLTLAFELINSAVEAVVDRIGTEYHELSGRAKDLGSACVFVLLILTAVVWCAFIGGHLGWWPL
ncbi:MAG: diacylglycerol kinase [Succinivibrionaceae bacterium]|nr:diacylglycerol kinase [Succinivibrionaceae bacterium]